MFRDDGEGEEEGEEGGDQSVSWTAKISKRKYLEIRGLK